MKNIIFLDSILRRIYNELVKALSFQLPSCSVSALYPYREIPFICRIFDHKLF